uniref:MSCRAMM family protein n=1 Tax=Actinomyces minihominis TaxID=2002838 RepID=UPI0024145B01
TDNRVPNVRIPGKVSWQKVDESDRSKLLGGSEWQLVGPAGEESKIQGIEDCVASSAGDCSGLDKDPVAGKFKLEGLAWGDYTLTETKAPAGYVKSDCKYTFTIEAANAGKSVTLEPEGSDCDLGDNNAIPNKQAEGPSLPLTGGASAFMIIAISLGLLGMAATLEALRRKKRSRPLEA